MIVSKSTKAYKIHTPSIIKISAEAYYEIEKNKMQIIFDFCEGKKTLAKKSREGLKPHLFLQFFGRITNKKENLLD